MMTARRFFSLIAPLYLAVATDASAQVKLTRLDDRVRREAIRIDLGARHRPCIRPNRARAKRALLFRRARFE